MDEEVIEGMPKKHPTYGCVVVTKSQIGGGGQALNGSSVLHNNIMHLQICEGEYSRSMGADWWSPRKTIVDIELSPVQFAEMITSVGNGCGTPCTIKYRADKPEEEDMRVPHINKFEEHTKEFRQDIAKTTDKAKLLLKQMEDRLKEKKPMGIREQQELLDNLRCFHNELGSNLTYASRVFDEQVERTKTEAKGEIEAFFDSRIRDLGMQALGKQLEVETTETPVIALE